MQPYGTPAYFIWLGLALIPLVIAHAYGKKWMGYQVLFTLAFLWLTFGSTMSIWSILGFGVFETLLIKLYEHYRTREGSANKTWVFVVAVLLSIAPLFVVKLTPVIDPAHPSSIIGFLGISYVTFKTVSTILEIRDGLIKALPVKDFLYFLYFYPTISSGPIDRFRRFQKDMQTPVDREKYVEKLGKGIFFIFQGFLYNFIIGYLIQTYVLHGVAIQAVQNPGFVNMAISAYAYGLYLFFNFAGYSLFAIGISYIMGIDTPINFNKPFLAKSIHDFWQRWHMSLSFWFRDFVFMRFVKFMMVKRWFKQMTTTSNVGYLVNMTIMGFWHGFTPYYVAYGIYHALLMIGYDWWTRFKKKRKIKIPDNRWTRAVSIFITFNAVMIGFLIFSGLPWTALQRALGMHVEIPNF
ncbi:D-alanyl-lipoteichoic acid biosynthesis protein DltB [Lactococcus termiticola]|uniref:Teichoic acid D-alanyltransferase n=1 Tax=Lactococcus termiticola TaxID=2169526 RepID=A0A2R5HGC7_9LACT|nr:D-alanyl-lipoteichoic acid biosynthesis protein DltB [Lactococcus termiticola]GBG97117.1 D-alanyl transfer protein DltB [Lactococcus termiticola]